MGQRKDPHDNAVNHQNGVQTDLQETFLQCHQDEPFLINRLTPSTYIHLCNHPTLVKTKYTVAIIYILHTSCLLNLWGNVF